MNSDELLDALNRYFDLLHNETIYAVRHFLFKIIVLIIDNLQKTFSKEVEDEELCG